RTKSAGVTVQVLSATASAPGSTISCTGRRPAMRWVRFANLQPLVVSIALAILTFEYLAQQNARLLNIPGLSPVGPCLRLKPDPLAAPPELAHEKPALGQKRTWQ